MSQTTRVNTPLSAPSRTEIAGFESLAELALDLRSSWNHLAGVAVPLEEARILWQR